MIHIVEDLLKNPFSMSRFTAFAAHFACDQEIASLDGFADTIRERYADCIDSCNHIGAFTSNDGAKIAFIAVKLAAVKPSAVKLVEAKPTAVKTVAVKPSAVKTAAVKNGSEKYSGQAGIVQRRFLSRILTHLNIDAAIAALYCEEDSFWRLSFVEKAEGIAAKGMELDYRPVRRCSFIAGDCMVHSATQNRLYRLIGNTSVNRNNSALFSAHATPSLWEIRKAFSQEEIAGEFIGEYIKNYSKEEINTPKEIISPPEEHITSPEEYITSLEEFVNRPLWNRYGFSTIESMPFDKVAAIDGNIVGALFESHLDEKARKRNGTFYTQPEIVQYMCVESITNYLSNRTAAPYADLRKFIQFGEWLIDENKLPDTVIQYLNEIDDALANVRVLDPAAGSGAFPVCMLNEIVKARMILVEYQIQARSAGGSRKRNDFIKSRSPWLLKKHAIENCIFAADIDKTAIGLTKLRLWLSISCEQETGLPAFSEFQCNTVCADSLLDELDWSDFDIIIGNPPYISAVEASRKDTAIRQALRIKYPLLKGSFDIYTAFLLDGIKKIRDDGIYCWIVPNKLLVSEYAAPVLNYLVQHGLQRIVSISGIGAFPGTGVYPVIVSGNRENSGFGEYFADTLQDLVYGSFKLKAEPRNYKTFADFGIKFASGAAGFQAKLLAGCISEHADSGMIPFIVSGSVDKYSVNYCNVRYMGRTYSRAYITKGDCFSEKKWDFWYREKIVIAGLTKGIEAFYSKDPLALGVGVYAIHSFAGFEPRFLLGLLNSKFMSWYLNIKFGERHLAGGYLAINKSTLEQLPLVEAEDNIQSAIADIVSRIREILAGYESEKPTGRITKGMQKIDAIQVCLNNIDQMVYNLYGLGNSEIKKVEDYFTRPT